MQEIITLVRLAAGDYETPDHRWQVRRNTDGTGCAPRSWWKINYRDAYVIQAANLATAKQIIAKLDRDFAKLDEVEDGVSK